MEAIYQLGFPGIKLHPAFQHFRIDGEKALSGICSGAETGSISDLPPVSIGTRISDYNVLLFDEVAYHFKNLRFSMEHVGGILLFLDAVAVMQNNFPTGQLEHLHDVFPDTWYGSLYCAHLPSR